jgi:VanZ family protein
MLKSTSRFWQSGNRIIDIAVLVVVLAMVFIGSSIPMDGIPNSNIFNYDKVIHLVEYLVVGLALFCSVRHSRRMHGSFRLLPFAGDKGKVIAFILIGGLLWAISDEVHQSFVGRDCSGLDLVADFCGLVLAALMHLTGTIKTAME